MRSQAILLTLVLFTNICYSTAHTFHGTTSSARFTCHCLGGTACSRGRGTRSGDCSSGCDRLTGNWAPWSGPGCQIGNVAYDKYTDQHVHTDATYPSSRAVDGLMSRSVSDEQCSMASRPPSGGAAYWYVDLGSSHVVQTVYITTVSGHREARNEIDIYVSYSTSYDPADECTSKSGSNVINVNCNNKIGRYVTVAGTTSNAELWLTEVYVKGYQYYQCNQQYSGDYWYGPACLNNCHCSRQCDAVTGVCGGICKAGYTGSTCQTICSNTYWGENCANRCYCFTCDRVTGSCGGRTCYAGWRGASCSQQCASYTWGAGSSTRGCPKSCNCARSNEICTRSNGHCPSGCAQWFTKTGCDYEMPRLGESDVPLRVDGNGRNVTIRFMQWSTSMGGDGRATDMSYKLHFFVLGSDADQENAYDEVIEHIVSDAFNIINCTLPDVRTNYTIRMVPYEYSTNYRGAGEPSPDLHVYTECKDGWFGIDCENTCGCSTEVPCDTVTGECLGGCSEQRLGADCSIDTPSLANVNVYTSITDDIISVSFDKLPRHNKYTVQYIIQFRSKGTQYWEEVTDNRKRSVDTKIKTLLNSLYEIQVLPEVHDFDNKRYVRGDASPIAEVSSGCAHKYDAQFSSSCTHWCDCGEMYCLKQGEHCNGVCSSCIDLPGLNNTGLAHTATSNSINLQFSYSGLLSIAVFCVEVFDDIATEAKLFKKINASNNAAIDIKGLSASSSYYLHITALTMTLDNEFYSPPFMILVTTRSKGVNVGLILGIILVVLILIAAGITIAVVFFKFRNKKLADIFKINSKHSKATVSRSSQHEYYNVAMKHNNRVSEDVYVVVDGNEQAEESGNVYANVEKMKNLRSSNKETDAIQAGRVKTKLKKLKNDRTEVNEQCSVKRFIKQKHTPEELNQEYKTIPENSKATTERGDLKENFEKHRFNNIKAYDYSRVVLEAINGDSYSDYINACYIDGYAERKKAYVAAQGPRKPTVDDMWRLIWKINTKVIVMLTKLTENEAIKCQPYWSKEEVKTYHDVHVETIETSVAMFYTKRVFLAKRGDESREIVHLQFTHWPDHGVPDTPYDLLEFYHIVKSYHLDEDQPLLVHCSAGVGRTGTFIALDYLVQQAAQEKVVDVFSCVAHLRKFRCQMVQAACQYQYLHEVLKSYLQSHSELISPENFLNYFDNLIPSQCEIDYNSIENPGQTLDMSNCDALKPENRVKNRNDRFVPSNDSRMYLATPVPGTNNYIQAVICDSYRQSNSIILTQVPLPETVPDIWRLIYEQKVVVIVLLDSIDDDGDVYWPTLDAPKQYGPLQINLEREDESSQEGLITRKFIVKHKDAVDDLIVKQWHLHQGSSDLSSKETMSCWLSVYDQMQQYKKNQPADLYRSPTIVQCIDGCSRSGLFAVLWSVLEKLSFESVVNIDFAIRRVRKHRPEAVLDVQQYMALLRFVRHYLSDQQECYYNI